jgi:hypothetical protein
VALLFGVKGMPKLKQTNFSLSSSKRPLCGGPNRLIYSVYSIGTDTTMVGVSMLAKKKVGPDDTAAPQRFRISSNLASIAIDISSSLVAMLLKKRAELRSSVLSTQHPFADPPRTELTRR